MTNLGEASWSGILIDPAQMLIQTVQVGDWKSIRDLIDCPLLTMLRLNEANCLWLDDEGLIRAGGPRGLFEWAGYGQPLAGRGVVLGLTPDMGDTCSTSFTVPQVSRLVRWRPDLVFDRMETTEGMTNVPGLGPVATIRSEAKFRPLGPKGEE